MKFHSLRLPAALACLLLALALCACGQTQETPPAPSGGGFRRPGGHHPLGGHDGDRLPGLSGHPGEDGTYTVTWTASGRRVGLDPPTLGQTRWTLPPTLI